MRMFPSAIMVREDSRRVTAVSGISSAQIMTPFSARMMPDQLME